MAVLVEAQGELINEIDKSVESAVEYTDVGHKELKKAVHYQRSARKVRAATIAVVICLFCLEKMDLGNIDHRVVDCRDRSGLVRSSQGCQCYMISPQCLVVLFDPVK